MNKSIPISQPSITKLEVDYVTDAVTSGWVSSQGKYIQEFEETFAQYCGVRYALSTSSGTTALHLALLSYGIGAGDEVIVPDLTFVATANAVSYVGAKAICVDIDRDTLCIDPYHVERAITPNTRAIIAVHMYGHPADMDALMAIADEYDLILIEDAAEAHGAKYKGRRTGSLGHCGAFSFYGNKLMTCGEGGMLTTNDKSVYQQAQHLRDHAMSPSKRYWHDQVGYNYRITNLQAALGLAQLQRIDHLLARKRAIFERYRYHLSQLSFIRLNFTDENIENSYWMVTIELLGYTEQKREQFMAFLKDKGIDNRPFFYPMSDMPMYADGQTHTPIAHEVAAQGVNLPSYFDMLDEDIDYICEVIVRYLGRSLRQLTTVSRTEPRVEKTVSSLSLAS